MNDLESGEKVPRDIVLKTVDDFISKVQKIQEISVIDFLEFLTNNASQEDESKE